MSDLLVLVWFSLGMTYVISESVRLLRQHRDNKWLERRKLLRTRPWAVYAAEVQRQDHLHGLN